MLLLVKWAKSIFVNGLASVSKMTPGCEKSSFKQPVFNRDVTELSLVPESNVRPPSNIQETTSSVLSKKDVPKGDPQDSHQNVGPDLSITNVESCENVTVSPTPLVVSKKDVAQVDPQGQTSSHVEVEAIHSSFVETDGHQKVYTESSNKNVESLKAIHSSYVKTDGHQNVYPESSNKNVEFCENVTVSPTPFAGESSDKQVGTFEYEVVCVNYLMTPEEIAKQKDDEEFIKIKNQEEKAFYAKIVNDVLIRASRLKKIPYEVMTELIVNAQNKSSISITSNDINIELSKEFLVELHKNAYKGWIDEDMMDHIAKVIGMIDLIYIPSVDSHQLRMIVFPLSLADDAQQWWINEGEGKITV
ncbi:hypothetical protein Tco_0666143 [Tanacetum coccineum]